MANREQLAEINKARAGDVKAQISLAKRYLSGEPNLARNDTTALLWLERAAQKGSLDACMLIGTHISIETAQRSASPDSLLNCYKQAFSVGIDAAGLTFAELALMQPDRRPDLLADTRTILESLARKNVAKAQWLLVSAFSINQSFQNTQYQAPNTSKDDTNFSGAFLEVSEKKQKEWTTSAAFGGIPEAKLVLAESAWQNNNYQEFLQWALPEAELISQQYPLKSGNAASAATDTQRLTSCKTELLYRCVVCLCKVNAKELDKAVLYLEIAASEGHSLAQLSLGLWLAKMDSQIVPIPPHPKRASFERAIEWLTSAGDQGLVAAWYALSKVYLKAEFVGRSLVKAEHFLKCASELGLSEAQLELGTREWRMRHKSKGSDLNAALWLKKAARQGCNEAEVMLEKVAPCARQSAWAIETLSLLTSEAKKAEPFLTVRIELAALVGLSKLEALWLDIQAADQGHCLVVDVAQHARNTKRRLISIQKVEERQLIERMKLLFHGIESNKYGPEGDYRRRLYRLDKLLGKY